MNCIFREERHNGRRGKEYITTYFGHLYLLSPSNSSGRVKCCKALSSDGQDLISKQRSRKGSIVLDK